MQPDSRLDKIKDCLYRVTVKAVIINSHKLLVTKERDDEWWSLPGGGVDHGETIPEALKRELTEEMSVPPSEVTSNWKAVFVSIGAVIDGIPRANIYYKVEVPINTLKRTDHVIDDRWVTASELAKLDLSPTMQNVIEDLTAILNE